MAVEPPMKDLLARLVELEAGTNGQEWKHHGGSMLWVTHEDGSAPVFTPQTRPFIIELRNAFPKIMAHIQAQDEKYKWLYGEMDRAHTKIKAQDARIKELEGALRFYAEGDRMKIDNDYDEWTNPHGHKLKTLGSFARRALNKEPLAGEDGS